ncbi:flagellar biosynthesis protein FlhF [Bacillus sp. 31A1R]|uniref:Flagellar biosynthesis protein FlhF n=1 Tax=Robertmurraya mangrovi TaxID=3098077 RepID=A0ABU5J226_9BACI|nr:flagellar biosynthesis protein FlhF [Bacillus sp. 31A1R]MDZ5473464.1 flagellar biosynthesis protein FlhF [Bacillus sp. 31A1R]
MKVKKYIAPTMSEAMNLVRVELGNDAVILNSKVIQTGGFLGFFKKRSVEVIAAVDPTPKAVPKVKEKQKLPPVKQPKIDFIKEPTIVADTIKQSNVNVSPTSLDKSSTDLLKELADLKDLVKNIPNTNGQESVQFLYPEPIQKINRRLADQEVSPHIKDELLSLLLEKWYVDGANHTDEVIIEWAKNELNNRFSPYSYGEITFEKKYVNVVGPTGVGKTTTLAKIAADCALKYKKKVALITTDTYRIGAIEQLKTYAKILSIPLEVCYNLEDFKNACDTFRDFDVVLIDTAGRNFRNKQYVEDLKKVINYDEEMETLLVLALTSKQRDMEDIYKQFSIIKINKFIFTKADETSNFGAMVNLIDKYKIGVAYITNGQDVPDDMMSANSEIISKLILGVEQHERSS